MSCIYCNHYILYKLKEGYYKCAKCKRKFSPKKLDNKAKILHSFLQGLTALEISKKYNFSYATVIKEVNYIRKVMAKICEDEFMKKDKIIEYSEYLYIPKTNKKKPSSIYLAQNFLTIDYGNKVYNILLSNMLNYKSFSKEEIKNLFRQSYIINIKYNITIPLFWEYFEKFIIKFKGVKEENFFYYLKEAEFRFNKFKIELKDIL